MFPIPLKLRPRPRSRSVRNDKRKSTQTQIQTRISLVQLLGHAPSPIRNRASPQFEMKILVRLVSTAGKHRSSEAPTRSVFWIREKTGQLLPNQIADLDLDLDLGLGFMGIGNTPYSEISIGNFQHRPLKNQAYSKKSPQNYLYAYFPPACISHFSRPPQTCQKNRPIMLFSGHAYL